MKKTAIAFFLGVSLATAGTAYGEDIITTMIGKQVEGEFAVKVDGASLDKKAVVIDDTSYLPVRAIGEALNMDVKFDADLGIELTEKEAETTTTNNVTTEMSADDAEALKSAENQIVLSQSKIQEYKAKIAELDQKIAEEDGPQEKEFWTIQKEAAEQLLKANEDNIVSQQAYIAKIKAKYETPAQ